MMLRRGLLVFTLAAWSVLAGGHAKAAVYRCGNAYADVPCPQATVVEADDARSDADRAAGREVARRDAALAARMVADRESAERLLRPARAARVKAPSRPASSPTAPLARKTSRDRLRVGVDGNVVAIIPRKR